MGSQNNIHGGTILNTFCGTALAVAVNIAAQDILRTAVMAAVGAVVSFGVSVFLKWLVRRLKR